LRKTAILELHAVNFDVNNGVEELGPKSCFSKAIKQYIGGALESRSSDFGPLEYEFGCECMGKAVLYQEPGGLSYEVDLPLSSFVDVNEIMKELGLPSYIDLDYFPMRCAIVTIWACQKAPELRRLYPNVYEKEVDKKSIPALLFGGAAMKVCCEHSNGKGALSRSIKDVDFIVPKNQGSNFSRLLLGMSKAFGTEFTYFKTKGDSLFIAMRQGQRYRVRTINGVTSEGLPTVTVLDIFCDSIDLRHKIEVKDSFEHARENLFTIGLEYLILSKSQFIMDASKTDVAALLEKHGQEFRILPCPWYASSRVVLGMEEKDIKDVCSIFVDHALGEEEGEISQNKMRRILGKDKKLALTVTLNLQNMAARTELLGKWLNAAESAKVVDRINSLLAALPKVDKKWDKPWWNTAVETPLIG